MYIHCMKVYLRRKWEKWDFYAALEQHPVAITKPKTESIISQNNVPCANILFIVVTTSNWSAIQILCGHDADTFHWNATKVQWLSDNWTTCICCKCCRIGWIQLQQFTCKWVRCYCCPRIQRSCCWSHIWFCRDVCWAASRSDKCVDSKWFGMTWYRCRQCIRVIAQTKGAPYSSPDLHNCTTHYTPLTATRFVNWCTSEIETTSLKFYKPHNLTTWKQIQPETTNCILQAQT